MEEKVVTILNEMSEYLSIPQMIKQTPRKLRTKNFCRCFWMQKRLRGVQSGQFNIIV